MALDLFSIPVGAVVYTPTSKLEFTRDDLAATGESPTPKPVVPPKGKGKGKGKAIPAAPSVVPGWAELGRLRGGIQLAEH